MVPQFLCSNSAKSALDGADQPVHVGVICGLGFSTGWEDLAAVAGLFFLIEFVESKSKISEACQEVWNQVAEFGFHTARFSFCCDPPSPHSYKVWRNRYQHSGSPLVGRRRPSGFLYIRGPCWEA